MVTLSQAAFEAELYASYVEDNTSFDWKSEGFTCSPDLLSKEAVFAKDLEGRYVAAQLEVIWTGYLMAMNQQATTIH